MEPMDSTNPPAAADPVFAEEQAHLSETYAKLQRIEQAVRKQLEADLVEALADKEELFNELTRDFSSDIQLETLAELEAMNRIIESYNLSADINDAKLRRAGGDVYRLRIIHGYHGGTALRDLVRSRYRDHPKVKRVELGLNQGETELVLREL